MRNVVWIIDSIERLLARNPLQPSGLFNFKPGGSIYTRVETLMDPEKGLVGLPWSLLRQAWFGDGASRLILIRYEQLAQSPAQVLQRLYAELGESPFPHDFANVQFDEPDYDEQLGMPGLHRVRPSVEYRERETCLPPDLFVKYADVNFWTNARLNIRKVPVI